MYCNDLFPPVRGYLVTVRAGRRGSRWLGDERGGATLPDPSDAAVRGVETFESEEGLCAAWPRRKRRPRIQGSEATKPSSVRVDLARRLGSEHAGKGLPGT